MWKFHREDSAIGCLREIRRILNEIEEERITAKEGWNRISLVYLKFGNRILADAECEPVI